MKLSIFTALSLFLSTSAFSRGMLLTCDSEATVESCHQVGPDEECQTVSKIHLLTDEGYIHNDEYHAPDVLDFTADADSKLSRSFNDLIYGKQSCTDWDSLNECFYFVESNLFLLEKTGEDDRNEFYDGKVISKGGNVTTYSEVKCSREIL